MAFSWAEPRTMRPGPRPKPRTPTRQPDDIGIRRQFKPHCSLLARVRDPFGLVIGLLRHQLPECPVLRHHRAQMRCRGAGQCRIGLLAQGQHHNGDLIEPAFGIDLIDRRGVGRGQSSVFIFVRRPHPAIASVGSKARTKLPFSCNGDSIPDHAPQNSLWIRRASAEQCAPPAAPGIFCGWGGTAPAPARTVVIA